jgi:hypothetical protein
VNVLDFGEHAGMAVAGRTLTRVAVSEQVHCECVDCACGCGATCGAWATY